MANPVVARVEVTGSPADGFRPGHLAARAAPDGDRDVLRRAVSVPRADGDALDLLLPADPPPVLDPVAPLGTPCPRSYAPARALPPGEDTRAGPLPALAERLPAAGGPSGPAPRPIAVHRVFRVHAATRAGRMPAVPVLATGGVRTGRDALESTPVGASGTAVGSEPPRDPTAPPRILDEPRAEPAARGFAAHPEAVGLAHRTTTTEDGRP